MALAAALSLPAPAALAASTASASLDWSQFQIQTLLGDVTFGSAEELYTGVYSGLDTSNPNYSVLVSDNDGASDWTSTLSASVSDATFGNANSSANANTLSVSATSNYSNYSANSYAYRFGDFNFTGTGIVKISVPYTLEVSSDNTNPNQLGSAYASAYITATFSSNGFSENTNKFASLYDDFWNEAASRSGFLNMLFEIDGDAQLTLSGSASTSVTGATAVPVPAAMWLMGSAVLGIVTLGRRKPV